MEGPYIISINAVSGGGKTALARAVHQSLPSSALYCFDDFDESHVLPDNFYEWWQRGADVAMARRILRDEYAGGIEGLKRELADYLAKARVVYVDAYRAKNECDLVLDGTLEMDVLKHTVVERAKNERGKISWLAKRGEIGSDKWGETGGMQDGREFVDPGPPVPPLRKALRSGANLQMFCQFN